MTEIGWKLGPFETHVFQEVISLPSVRDAIEGYVDPDAIEENTFPIQAMHEALEESVEAIDRVGDPLFGYVVCVRLLSYYVGKMREASGLVKTKPSTLQ